MLTDLFLRWLALVSNPYTLMDQYYHFLSVDTAIMVSSKCLPMFRHLFDSVITESTDEEW